MEYVASPTRNEIIEAVADDEAGAADTAGTAYSDLIKEQLTQERATKGSLEQRALAVISSSGTLATLLFGLAALVSDREGFELPLWTRIWLIVGVVLFTAASILALTINSPERNRETSIEWMRKILQENYWKGDASKGAMRAAESRVNAIDEASEVNDGKAKRLRLAVTIEVAGVGAVALSVIGILLAG